MPHKQRYVAFLDILGFSAAVKRTEHDALPDRYDALVRTLEHINSREKHLDESVGDDFRFQTFSDSIVLSSNASEAGLIYLLYTIKQLVLNLLENGLFSRGAISKGSLHHVGSVMFGPAFLDAYRIEHAISKFPRVVLGEAVFDALRNMEPGLRNPSYVFDDDGPPFLHVLQDVAELNTKPVTIETRNSPEVLTAQGYQRALQNLIERSIHEPRHFEKAKWFGVYWNRVIGHSPEAVIAPVDFPVSRALRTDDFIRTKKQ